MTRSPEDAFFEAIGGVIESPPISTKKEAQQVPAPPRPLSSRSLFSHPDAHPFVLDLALLKAFRLEWLNWLPDTLFVEIEKTFGGSLAEVNRLKILAAQTLHVTDVFWEKWEIFEKTVLALNGIVPRLEFIQPPDLGVLLAGVDTANSIRKEKYGEEVARYVAAVFLAEHVHYAPEPVEFAQPYITQPTYCCQDCGKCGSALPPFDGMCTSCAGHFDDDKPFNFKPDQEAIERGAGRNLTKSVIFDPGPTKERFEELNKLPADKLRATLRETVEDVQAAKLITAFDYKSYQIQQRQEQVKALRGWLESA